MLETLSILSSTLLAGIFFTLIKLKKINNFKKINQIEAPKNKKWRIALIYLLIIFVTLFILLTSLILVLELNN